MLLTPNRIVILRILYVQGTFRSVILIVASATLQLVACASITSSNDTTRPEDFSPDAFAAACDEWDDWEKAAPPFHIHGGTYYVGTCGITAILITTPDGHLVIDRGTDRGGELVAANIEALGFSPRDVRYLTHTQEHWDHVGGMAYLKNRTGALMVASERARSVFETGAVNTDDPQYGLHDPMATLSVDNLVVDGEALVLGNKKIVARLTPGHSPGAISWRWEECQDAKCYVLVFTDGMGPISADGYSWTDHPEYLADYRAAVAWFETVDPLHHRHNGAFWAVHVVTVLDRATKSCGVSGNLQHQALHRRVRPARLGKKRRLAAH